MSADKRSVATDALETLGTIIDHAQRRDAIHLAVEPIVAGQDLRVGQDVTLRNGRAFAADDKNGLGIVDPFLKAPVKHGERFWLVVYPRQINSLRHVWTHPAFPHEQLPGDEPSYLDKVASEMWLRNFIDTADCPGYEAVIEAAINTVEDGDDVLHIRGDDAHGEIPPEFWSHLEAVTGVKVSGKRRPNYFSCSC